MAKNAAQQRKGRLYKQILMGLSWHSDVQIQVPEALWRIVGYGWPHGCLLKSTTGIQDPDSPSVRWDAWVFGLHVIYIRSSLNPNLYINLSVIGHEARAHPADSPTEGL